MSNTHLPPKLSNTHRARVVAAGLGVSALTLVSLGLGAGPASADSTDIPTSSVTWTGVDDTTGSIRDAYQHDFASNVDGWTDDAFDGYGNFTLSDPVNEESWNFVANPGESTSDIVAGGTSTLTMHGTTDWAVDNYDVVLTLTLEGNYARWSYAISGPQVATLVSEFDGNLGSDDASTFLTSDTTVVSDDTGSGDPVLGYSVATDGTFDGWTTVEGDDQPSAQATGASVFAVTLVATDWNACGFDEAKAFVESIVADLPGNFGESYQTSGSCIVFAPVSLQQGVPVNQVLSYTVDQLLTDDLYFSDNVVTAELTDLPTGLSYTSVRQDDGSIVITLTGTPTASGTFTPTAVFFIPTPAGNPTDRLAPTSQPGSRPVYSTVSLSIAAIPVPAVITPAAATATPLLAATGFDGGLLGGLAALASVVGAAVVMIQARRRRV
ncbi:hypothetical protein IWX89_002613 [Cryobacterium sp. MP_M3]|uniref:hypothetical protein n=1 Tax=unclassified Cryobacterium TaxID=2649013 RepID=UPI0018C8F6FA|nr:MULTISPECIES: hypothetical protein [unclassified Cryobacterium]MBG6059160.1 hypothetical protein [Cryobacterium sp. MP_M3]